jgi:hypothetical protein
MQVSPVLALTYAVRGIPVESTAPRGPWVRIREMPAAPRDLLRSINATAVPL